MAWKEIANVLLRPLYKPKFDVFNNNTQISATFSIFLFLNRSPRRGGMEEVLGTVENLFCCFHG